MRFLGNIEAKTDVKGRAFLPAVFRKELQNSGEEHIVMRKDVFQQCLVLYPETVWNAQMDVLRKRLNRWDRKHQSIFRQFVSDAEIITLDTNGRFLIPKRYLKLAGIDQSIRFIGMDDTIEIWSSEIAERPFMEPDDFGKALEELMAEEANEAGE
ncbi:MAG: division/cell wall cluster transcriptional repressor MraZ [Prevotellaceae bacterium]|nr:division/cell wall cluster transcriptional repressor MraZ [Prevotellaceae bacterium]